MKKTLNGIFLIGVTIAFFFILFQMAKAVPEGALVEYVSNTTKAASNPQSRTDAKGTITTLLLYTIQQNFKWKAYVGNVSGTLVLRDAEDYSIYEWPSGGNPDGEVYITMNNTINWDTIQCANVSQIQTLETSLGFTLTAADNINNTFANRIHETIVVGEYTIPSSTCKSLATWVNATQQTLTTSSLFQEVLLMDSVGRIIFTALIDQNKRGYNNKSLYDFQAIVPDYAGLAVATYYFYVEISG